MSPRRRIYARPDGTVAGVVTPDPKSRRPAEPTAVWEARALAAVPRTAQESDATWTARALAAVPPIPEESEADWLARVMAKAEAASVQLAETVEAQARAHPGNAALQEHAAAVRTRVLVGLTFYDCDTADLPDRAMRHAWRVVDGRCVVDPTIPKPVPARQRAALAELKAALADTP
jgi:hypothetical protein